MQSEVLIPIDGAAAVLSQPDGALANRTLWKTRVAASAALVGLMVAVGSCGQATYHALSDAFVAPIILSPDSELVIQSKLNLNRLLAERDSATARIEECSAAVAAADQGIASLGEFEGALRGALEWTRTMTNRQLAAGSRELEMLAQQRGALDQIKSQQAAYVEQLSKQRAAGLVHAAEVEREQGVLGQLRVATLQNGRERASAEAQLGAAKMSKNALTDRSAHADLATPEMVVQQDHLLRTQLELLKLRADRHARLAQLKADQNTRAKIDELVADMQARPIFRAIGGNQHVAFVPYTQIRQVERGARVFECKLWGIALCEDVGAVEELLRGEVVMQDPWGKPARGQYALLKLADPLAAQAKALRVRGGERARARASVAGGTAVAATRSGEPQSSTDKRP